jgi:hypothetical protein
MLDTYTTGVLTSAASTVKSSFTSGGSFGNYVADISKGILIIVIGGLAAGMVLSLVSSFLPLRRFARCQSVRAAAAPVQGGMPKPALTHMAAPAGLHDAWRQLEVA